MITTTTVYGQTVQAFQAEQPALEKEGWRKDPHNPIYYKPHPSDPDRTLAIALSSNGATHFYERCKMEWTPGRQTYFDYTRFHGWVQTPAQWHLLQSLFHWLTYDQTRPERAEAHSATA